MVVWNREIVVAFIVLGNSLMVGFVVEANVLTKECSGAGCKKNSGPSNGT